MPSEDFKLAGSLGLLVAQPSTTVASGSCIQGRGAYKVLDKRSYAIALLLRTFDSAYYIDSRLADT